MEYGQAKQMMLRCREEIVSLRNQIATLAPKAEAYDMLKQTLDLMPKRSQGMGEDVVWIIQRELNELEKREKEEAKAQTKPSDTE